MWPVHHTKVLHKKVTIASARQRECSMLHYFANRLSFFLSHFACFLLCWYQWLPRKLRKSVRRLRLLPGWMIHSVWSCKIEKVKKAELATQRAKFVVTYYLIMHTQSLRKTANHLSCQFYASTTREREKTHTIFGEEEKIASLGA